MKKNIHKISLEQTRAFSTLLSDYLAQKDTISAFASYAPSAAGIQQAVAACRFPTERRQVLQEVLTEQYSALSTPESVSAHLQKIGSSDTFFVTTGQQIHVLGGPLYVLFKIASTIKLAAACQQLMPDKHFIPLFWMASEDHDLEEIDHLNLFGKRQQVSLPGKGPAGRVGTAPVSEWADGLADIPASFRKAYQEHGNLSAATRCWLNDLFGKHGLVVIDGDHPKLKQQFIPVLEKELFEGLSSEAVRTQTAALEDRGYKGQIFPRDINLFYISAEGRNRMTKEGENYTVLNTDLVFTKENLQKELHAHPESFSPNVVLRPVYQEYILPNVAYIGGPAEVAYWMQLGKVFELFGMNMPVVLPRNFAMVVSKALSGKLHKLELKVEDIFLPEEELKQTFFKQKDYTLPEWTDVASKLDELWALVSDKTLKADGNLKDWLAAEKHRLEKQLETIEKRVAKTYEQKLEQEMKQLSAVKEKLLPGGGLQERSDSFLSFLINDPTFVDDVVALLDPLDYRFHIITYED